MSLSITGIIANVVMIIIIIAILIFGMITSGELHKCETDPSTFCYVIQCPCDDPTQGPCFGYAKRPAGVDGQWYCSNNPDLKVDNSGTYI